MPATHGRLRRHPRRARARSMLLLATMPLVLGGCSALTMPPGWTVPPAPTVTVTAPAVPRTPAPTDSPAATSNTQSGDPGVDDGRTPSPSVTTASGVAGSDGVNGDAGDDGQVQTVGTGGGAVDQPGSQPVQCPTGTITEGLSSATASAPDASGYVRATIRGWVRNDTSTPIEFFGPPTDLRFAGAGLLVTWDAGQTADPTQLASGQTVTWTQTDMLVRASDWNRPQALTSTSAEAVGTRWTDAPLDVVLECSSPELAIAPSPVGS